VVRRLRYDQIRIIDHLLPFCQLFL
jgi:hypothetical protein